MLRRSRVEEEWPGAARERGGAEGGICAGGAAVEERGDGELEVDQQIEPSRSLSKPRKSHINRRKIEK